jgi:RNA polymerase sigma factor (sigma-70 family)
MVEPPDIKQIFDKPGRMWTPEERTRVKEWLLESPQLKKLLSFALYYLGEDAAVADAEDAWHNFYVRRLDLQINLYDPARGRRFRNFLLFCFERFCRDERQQLKQRSQRTVPLEKESQTPAGETFELDWLIMDEKDEPETAAERREIRLALQRCIDALSPAYKTVIILHYFEEQSLTKMSVTLGLTEGNVKMRLYRARQKLAECLEDRQPIEGEAQ